MNLEDAAKLTPAVIEEVMRKRERERKARAERAQEEILREADFTGILVTGGRG